MKRRTDEEILRRCINTTLRSVQSTDALPVWTKQDADRCAAPFVWLPASWTRKIRSTASMTLKN